MNNLEIIKQIDNQIEICREKIRARSVEESKTIISDIENLIEQYQAENDTQIRIIKNRTADVDILKNSAADIPEKTVNKTVNKRVKSE